MFFVAKDRLISAHGMLLASPIKEDCLIRLERNNAWMFKLMCSVLPEDGIFAAELRNRLQLNTSRQGLSNKELWCLYHLERLEESSWPRKFENFDIGGSLTKGQSRETLNKN